MIKYIFGSFKLKLVISLKFCFNLVFSTLEMG